MPSFFSPACYDKSTAGTDDMNCLIIEQYGVLSIADGPNPDKVLMKIDHEMFVRRKV